MLWLLNPHCYLKHTHINTYGRTRPAVQNLVLCLKGSDPTCHVGAAQAPPPPQQGSRAGSVTLVSWIHTVPPTAYCLLGKIKKLGGEKLWAGSGQALRGGDVVVQWQTQQPTSFCMQEEWLWWKSGGTVQRWGRSRISAVWVCLIHSQLRNLDCRATETTDRVCVCMCVSDQREKTIWKGAASHETLTTNCKHWDSQKMADLSGDAVWGMETWPSWSSTQAETCSLWPSELFIVALEQRNRQEATPLDNSQRLCKNRGSRKRQYSLSHHRLAAS